MKINGALKHLFNQTLLPCSVLMFVDHISRYSLYCIRRTVHEEQIKLCCIRACLDEILRKKAYVTKRRCKVLKFSGGKGLLHVVCCSSSELIVLQLHIKLQCTFSATCKAFLYLNAIVVVPFQR